MNVPDKRNAMASRTASITRETKETKISAQLTLGGSGSGSIQTGIGFFDHMLDQLARHGRMDLSVKADGDLHIDAHHTVEDCGIVLGRCLSQALGDKRGIERFGEAHAPLDEALCRAVVDVSGRPYLAWRVSFTQSSLGGMDTELFEEFFRAFVGNAKLSVHVDQLAGTNNHHVIESAFKAFARALRAAVRLDPDRMGEIPSTKGTL